MAQTRESGRPKNGETRESPGVTATAERRILTMYGISRDEIKRRLDDPTLLLIDVLPHEAYAVEHIPGATNLPLAELETRALQMLPDRNADIAAYCGKFT
jgi:3-mercaptopyruvate sulfurtransferase SseA